MRGQTNMNGAGSLSISIEYCVRGKIFPILVTILAWYVFHYGSS